MDPTCDKLLSFGEIVRYKNRKPLVRALSEESGYISTSPGEVDREEPDSQRCMESLYCTERTSLCTQPNWGEKATNKQTESDWNIISGENVEEEFPYQYLLNFNFRDIKNCDELDYELFQAETCDTNLHVIVDKASQNHSNVIEDNKANPNDSSQSSSPIHDEHRIDDSTDVYLDLINENLLSLVYNPALTNSKFSQHSQTTLESTKRVCLDNPNDRGSRTDNPNPRHETDDVYMSDTDSLIVTNNSAHVNQPDSADELYMTDSQSLILPLNKSISENLNKSNTTCDIEESSIQTKDSVEDTEGNESNLNDELKKDDSVKTKRNISGEEEEAVFVPSDLERWCSSDIRHWLTWCTREFKFPKTPDAAKFPDSGSGLCCLSKYDMIERCSDYHTGKTLFSHLTYLKTSGRGLDCTVPPVDTTEDEGK
ncbi:hypothetical protein M8J77_006824 [Diaphorina citri]|nr:hypothetical protein M8J77_006824 [Diaphorina citri]